MGAKVVILPFSTKFFKYFLPFSTKFISVICHFPPNLVGKPVFESMWVSWVRVTLGSLQYIGSPWIRGTYPYECCNRRNVCCSILFCMPQVRRPRPQWHLLNCFIRTSSYIWVDRAYSPLSANPWYIQCNSFPPYWSISHKNDLWRHETYNPKTSLPRV